MTQEAVNDIDVNSYYTDDINLSLVAYTDWLPDMAANSYGIKIKRKPRKIIEFVDEGILKWLMDPGHPIFVYLRSMSRVILANLDEYMIFDDVKSAGVVTRNTYVIGFKQCSDDYVSHDKSFYIRYPCYDRLRYGNCVQIAIVGCGSCVKYEMTKALGRLTNSLKPDIKIDVIMSARSAPVIPGNLPTKCPRIQLLDPLHVSGQADD